MRRYNDDQRAMLRRILALVREAFPTATWVELETTDQNMGHSFWLTDVEFADGTNATDTTAGEQRLEVLQEVCYDDLYDLLWNGVVGEDKHGYASVPVLSAVQSTDQSA